MNRTRAAGFSLVELLVATTLGMVAISAIGHACLAGTRSYRASAQQTQTQDSLRFAMAQIARDIEMAGFFAGVAHPAERIRIPAATRDAYGGARCAGRWLFDDLLPVDTIGNASRSEIKAKFPCVRDAHDRTDVLAIKRVLGACETVLWDNRLYLQSDGLVHVLRYGGAGLPAAPLCRVPQTAGTINLHQYHPVIWYVGTDQGVRALCRERLSGPRMARDCVAQGIDDLQLEFGFEAGRSAAPADGAADYYVSVDLPPDDAVRARIVAVRVHLLGRSIGRLRQPPPAAARRTFQLGNVVHEPPADGHHRASLSATVPVRNAARRLRPVALH